MGWMQRRLTTDEIVALLDDHPEQALFDWKRDFTLPKTTEAKAEFIKDVTALANAAAFHHGTGYILYGVHPGGPTKLVGVGAPWDDAKLQQLVFSHTDPPVTFLYYEVEVAPGVLVAVVTVYESPDAPHLIRKDVGSLREGQCLIRDGSTTRGIRPNELAAIGRPPDEDARVNNLQKLRLIRADIAEGKEIVERAIGASKATDPVPMDNWRAHHHTLARTPEARDAYRLSLRRPQGSAGSTSTSRRGCTWGTTSSALRRRTPSERSMLSTSPRR